MPGGSLFAQLHQKCIPLSRPTQVSIALQIARGVFFLHSSGVIHRDLKSPNILMNENCTIAKVVDFGLSKTKAAQSLLVTHVGTPEYMAPEVMQGRPYSFSADVFAVGLIIYEVIVRKLPYSPELPIAAHVFNVVQGKRPPIPPALPQSWVQILTSLWHADPNQRMRLAEAIWRMERIDAEVNNRPI